MSTKPSLPARLAIGCIRLYQRTLSPLLGQRCRFYPTCSVYGIEAITRKGVVIGGLMAGWRILRCNPFNPGGHDPVEKVDAPESAQNDRDENGG